MKCSQHSGEGIHEGTIGPRGTLADDEVRNIRRKDIAVSSTVLPVVAYVVIAMLGIKVEVVAQVMEGQTGGAVRLGEGKTSLTPPVRAVCKGGGRVAERDAAE